MLLAIDINNRTRIADIQHAFQKAFPYLTIGFFYHNGRESDKSLSMKKVGDLRDSQNTGSISIRGDMTVAELEKRFALDFGLNIKVFRKYGESWLTTTVTTEWTLDEQNQEGALLSSAKR